MSFAANARVRHFAVAASFVVSCLLGVASPQVVQAADVNVSATICSTTGSPALTIVNPNTSTIATHGNSLAVQLQLSDLTTLTVTRDSTLIHTEPAPTGSNITHTLTLPLALGTHSYTISGTSICPSATINQTLTIARTAASANMAAVRSSQRSPALSGTMSPANGYLIVTINGTDYVATINGDGTWTLPAGTIAPELSEGLHSATLTLYESNGGTLIGTYQFSLRIEIDTTSPHVAITTNTSTSRSPEIMGTINDPQATIVVTINGRDYTAHNNGDGTWTLPAGTIAPELASGSYEVVVRATDQVGNTVTHTQTLTINAPGELGFILAPNTGYLRLGGINIPSWSIYLGLVVIAALFVRLRRSTEQPQV